MDEFLAFYKETLLEKIRERSDTHCYGCILGEQDRRDHACQNQRLAEDFGTSRKDANI